MIKIFIAEDDSSMARLYENAFRLSGHEVEIVSDGEEALKNLLAMEEVKPDVILLDIMMPKLNGFDVLAIIKKNDRLKDIPVVALTNLASLPGGSQDLKKIRSLGAVDVIIKSQTDPKEVVKKVEQLIGNR